MDDRQIEQAIDLVLEGECEEGMERMGFERVEKGKDKASDFAAEEVTVATR